MYDVITCGSATVDVFVESDNTVVKLHTTHGDKKFIAYESGAKILIDELLYSVGGGGTNTAVSFARLGLKTGYIGCIGTDDAADSILHLLQKEHIDFLGHKHAKVKSGYSVILDSVEHDRTILTHKGANNYLSYAKIKKKSLSAKWFYFSSMVADSYNAQVQIAKTAHTSGSKIAFNPSEYQVRLGMSAIKDMLDVTDLLVFNKEEATILCNETEYEKIFSLLHAQGISTIIITDGGDKLVYSHNGESKWIQPKKVEVVESTGAGDAFASACVAWLAANKSLDESIIAGLCNSQSVITSFGAKEHLLTQKELVAYEKKMKVKVNNGYPI